MPLVTCCYVGRSLDLEVKKGGVLDASIEHLSSSLTISIVGFLAALILIIRYANYIFKFLTIYLN
jgi:hypothetical protein